MKDERNRRVLVIDDTPEIHADFMKLLASGKGQGAELQRLRASLFGKKGAAGGEAVGFEVTSAHQGAEGAEKVAAALAEGRPYALAFVDMRMPPGWDGVRTIQELWRADTELQIVVCTAFSDNPWEEVEAVAGETDRLLVLKKPFDSIEVKRLAATLTAKWDLSRKAAMKRGELEALVRERTAALEQAQKDDAVRLVELEAAVEKRTAELRRAATHDALTGLPNRTLFHDRLSQALGRAAREAGNGVGVLFIDLDRFKVINDGLGHAAGDELLRAIAGRLTEVLRETDTVTVANEARSTAARLGGDEFCLLLTGLSRVEDAERVAARVLAAMEQTFMLGAREVTTAASIGVAVSLEGKEAAETMVRDADNAMYRAKETGKGRYVVFDREMHRAALERLTIENDLLRSVERRELRTFYQPVVSLESGQVVGAEALVRWQHPERGRVGPTEFIGVAEEIGFIEKLGMWVLEDACRQTAQWRRSIPAAARMRVNVNVSNRQLYDRRFGDRVIEVLGRTGLEAEGLALEITESVLMERSADIDNILAGLRRARVRMLLDDFGTGYSSLSMLRTFPLDGLKIDRSFLVETSGQRRFAAVIRAIMSLVRNLGMECVTEGVESIDQVALLQALGCEKGQGYLFSPPVAAEQMEELLRKDVRTWHVPNPAAA